MTAKDRTFVIVGAGLAGAKAAETLRAEGFDGRVVLLGAEAEAPYERPPLSKKYLRGESARESALVHPPAFYGEQGIELLPGRTACELALDTREVVLDGGERLGFDRLLLATGAEPRRLPLAGADLDGVHVLRTLADADALRAHLDRAARIVVIGAGWIGCEVAASARQRGLDVTVVEPAAMPLERVLGPELGAFYRDVHADHGVRLLLETGVEGFEGAAAVERVRLTDGRALDCDLVVAGVGAAPRVELAAAAGLSVGDGVLADERLRTSDPDVLVAGDIAAARHPLHGRHVRVEHWANALHQGPAAARTMLGREEPYDRVPYFFSDQFDVGMEYTGLALEWDRVVHRGDPAAREFIAFWLLGERAVAGMNVNVWDVADDIAALVRSGARVDAQRLADPGVPLADLVPVRA